MSVLLFLSMSFFSLSLFVRPMFYRGFTQQSKHDLTSLYRSSAQVENEQFSETEGWTY